MSPQDLVLYVELQTKRDRLFDYVMRLHSLKTPENETYINNEISRANFELDRLDAVMSDLRNNTLITYPTAAQFEEMRAAVAALQVAVAQSAALEELVAAGMAVIAAFPT